MEEGDKTRIAIVTKDCKPKKCRQECRRSCPVNRMGKRCIEVTANDKRANISEDLCIGCGICSKKCPFEAIRIINLPNGLAGDTAHRYGPNQFKLHRLPVPRPQQVLGLVGTNGIGKSTALKVLAGKLKPNLGYYSDPPEWLEIIHHYRGSELQNYFTKVVEDDMKVLIKPQYVDHIPKAAKGAVRRVMNAKNKRGILDEVCQALDLEVIMDRKIPMLSGGELQRFAIGVVVVQQAQIYMFDEPSSYLDIKQRLKAARLIRSIVADENPAEATKFVIVVEHDLSVLDYLSDFVCVLYGNPGAYGVVTSPFSVREGINVFLSGFVPTENLRFRDFALSFKVADNTDRDDNRLRNYDYPDLHKTMGDFTLHVETGEFTDSEIIVLLGENGTGKTTFIKLLAGILKPDNDETMPPLNISYKPQTVSPNFNGTVRMMLQKKLGRSWTQPQFTSDVVKPLQIPKLLDQMVKHLSGGEIQRVALCLTLGKSADIYLIDEPSAYLDSEQRIIAAKVIKRFILHAKKTAFVVEHDFIMATYLADRVVVYDGIPSIECTARSPTNLLDGMNTFLRMLEITFRRDPTNYRPRINKLGSQMDTEQKAAGEYFCYDATD
eukprot:TRINITY_DN3978_c0_g1_i1.p1 TRINITY_DN3978_c0_g1~~TRINITY_DN3978_c0_g1_i1.p1  ORF type:complete len:607 (-),score=158.38 TRINITY_DN3978_c0_g1_i1:37-1857(-)